MRVHIVEVKRGRETTVGVRCADSGAVLFACVGVGVRGASVALVEAVSFVAREGHTFAVAVGSRLVAMGMPDGTRWVLPAECVLGRSSSVLAAELRALRAAITVEARGRRGIARERKRVRQHVAANDAVVVAG